MKLQLSCLLKEESEEFIWVQSWESILTTIQVLIYLESTFLAKMKTLLTTHLSETPCLANLYKWIMHERMQCGSSRSFLEGFRALAKVP